MTQAIDPWIRSVRSITHLGVVALGLALVFPGSANGQEQQSERLRAARVTARRASTAVARRPCRARASGAAFVCRRGKCWRQSRKKQIVLKPPSFSIRMQTRSHLLCELRTRTA